MADTTLHAAVDLGASSGRVVLGRIGPDTLEFREAARFPNGVINLPDGLHWNLVGLYEHALNGLAAAVRQAKPEGGLASVAVDSWAVDYGLLASPSHLASKAHGAAAPKQGDDAGSMTLLGTPFHYRDSRTGSGVEAVHATADFAELYRRNGLQFLPFNTLYQLAAEPLLAQAQKLLLVPDLLGYWLTGQMLTEATNASTTGLLDVRTTSSGAPEWDTDLMETLGLSRALFTEVAAPGATLGWTREELTPLLGQRLPVTLVGSHDTASAIVGTPLSTPDAAYISCGTWGLVGLELDEPVVTDASREANFTNEGGVDGRIRFLTNVMGTWLLSETLRTWERQSGKPQDLPALLEAAAEVPNYAVAVFDVQDERFVAPGDMPARIAELCAEQEIPAPETKPEIVRSIVESIAAGFAAALTDAARLAGRSIDVVHMVGGGSLNTLLCQATADRSGYPVVAGPVEATAIGNLLIQARTAGTLNGSLEDLRELIIRTNNPETYRPR
ncbi:rhamnulokinase [Nesterenkonia flava]|uniref:Rhamnulokinase family protein n=1 Tax=Nesterenkonia flava TaxID=469799 RepID=A0ABU1FS95_9MICC|nr:rhamnulokinase family protein [Nesterenkonia flava]MDR5711525.1 rhamnulokinase family protein [Nesterenkonia flava]